MNWKQILEKETVVAFEHKEDKYVHFLQPIHSGMPSPRGTIS
jgi:hypothetical protein